MTRGYDIVRSDCVLGVSVRGVHVWGGGGGGSVLSPRRLYLADYSSIL